MMMMTRIQILSRLLHYLARNLLLLRNGSLLNIDTTRLIFHLFPRHLRSHFCWNFLYDFDFCLLEHWPLRLLIEDGVALICRGSGNSLLAIVFNTSCVGFLSLLQSFISPNLLVERFVTRSILRNLIQLIIPFQLSCRHCTLVIINLRAYSEDLRRFFVWIGRPSALRGQCV